MNDYMKPTNHSNLKLESLKMERAALHRSIDDSVKEFYALSIKYERECGSAGESYMKANVDVSITYCASNESHTGVKHGDIAARIASYHYYLTDAVLETAKCNTDIDTLFDMGEDSFVTELFQYSVIFYQLVDDVYNKLGDLPGVAVYELSKSVAGQMWVSLSVGEFPNVAEFRDKVSQLIEQWV